MRVFLWVLFLAGPVEAGPVLRLSWQDVIELVDRHPSLAVGAAEVEAARAEAATAGAAPNPSLEATLGRGAARVGGEARAEWGLALSVPLGWLAQRSAKVAVAEAGVELALAEREALRREVLQRLLSLFWGLAGAEARVASLEDLEAQTAAWVRTVSLRVEKGDVRPVEATRAELELEEVEGELEAERTTLAARGAELALWLSDRSGATLRVDADLSAVPSVPELDEALAKARRAHPALAASRARSRARAADVAAEERARLPDLALAGFTAHELDRTAYGAGLTVDLPLWNWNGGRVSAARARLAAAERAGDVTALELEASVIEAQAACRGSVRSATRLGEEVLPRARKVASTLEKTWQLGDTSLLDVIDARRTLLEARRDWLQALTQAHLDCGLLGALMEGESR